MAYKIIDTCIACGVCMAECPVEAISEGDPIYIIDPELCTDCGACERACPVGINMRVLTKKLEKDCLDNFGWEAGLTPDQRPPLDTFKTDDPEEFIK